MPPRPIPASFWRGGTSRGLVLRASVLSPFPPHTRDQILLTALGSPDPAGRQISGLGGGVSSLSKACVVGAPGEGAEAQNVFGKLPGVEWADDRAIADGLDVVYRFCQVGVRDTTMDWAATCGNMLAAVAMYTIQSSLVPYTTLFARARALPPPVPGHPLHFPLRILSAANGQIMHARVPLDPVTLQLWEPPEGEGCVIAGVPGEAAGIEVEMPIEVVEGAEGGLVTGRARDVLHVDGLEIPVSILTSGLPNIFVPITSLNLPQSLLSSPSLLTHPTLPSLLERIRQSAAHEFHIPLSLASPKIVLIGPVPEEGFYTTSVGTKVGSEELDLLVRAVSSGDWHATIPGTTLGALNLGLGTAGTVIQDVVRSRAKEEVVTVRAGHAAGVASASVRFVDEGGGRRPVSVVMMRTAREIMRGEVLVPEKAFEES